MKKVKEIIGKAGPLVAVVIMAVVLAIVSDKFLTIDNFQNLMKQTLINGFLSMGVMAAILTAGIDLSVGYIMTLSAIFMAFWCVKWELNPVLGMILGVVVGILLGTVNGLLLTKAKLPHPFISTLGTQNIYKGVGLVVTGATPIAGLPAVVKWAGSASITSNTGIITDKIPAGFIIMIIVYVLYGIFLTRTTLGRHIYAVGGNLNTAALSGINTDFVRTIVYSISGLFCGLGAIMQVGRTNSAYPLAGNLLENDAIAAVIIGGTSMFGGKGDVLGTFMGVILIALVRNGMNLLSISSDMQTIVLGAIIILAVFVDVVRSGGFARVKKIDKDKKEEKKEAKA